MTEYYKTSLQAIYAGLITGGGIASHLCMFAIEHASQDDDDDDDHASVTNWWVWIGYATIVFDLFLTLRSAWVVVHSSEQQQDQQLPMTSQKTNA